jgi:hypothetical protein
MSVNGNSMQREVRRQIEDTKIWTESVSKQLENDAGRNQSFEFRNSSPLIEMRSMTEQSESKEKTHFDQLHDLARVKQETRQLIIKEKEKLEEQSIKECTFTPKILNSSVKLAEKSGEDLFQRSEHWANNKNSKIKNIKEVYEEKELLNCTFKPTPFSNKDYLKSRENKIEPKIGIEKFLERQNQARQEKERVKNILSGNNHIRKDKLKEKNTYKQRHLKVDNSEIDTHFEKLKGAAFGDAVISLHNLLAGLEVRY